MQLNENNRHFDIMKMRDLHSRIYSFFINFLREQGKNLRKPAKRKIFGKNSINLNELYIIILLNYLKI